MCPPVLKRGDSDGDDSGNNSNNLRGGEEQHLPAHHLETDNSASSTSNNIIDTSSNIVKMGTSHDGFKKRTLWKSSDSDDNQNKDDGDQRCEVCLFC